ncbi:MAG: carbamoyltransferase [Planctomycetales bacterium]|nr:carbamoyltransferase [Planctomycetales bacterium]
MTSILGISAFYHDSAAALIVDGQIVAAAQEERFSRKKHDDSFPKQAVDYCLAEAGITPGELDYVGFYDKPLLKFGRLLETYLSYAPSGFGSFLQAVPQWLKRKLYLPREISRALGGKRRRRFVFTEHHESHAASAFFPSPFDEAAILTVDGVGEWATASFGTGRGNRIDLTHELHFPHSLGLLYSAFTYFCGFKVNSGEYKLMGLAPFGEPKYADLILEKLIDLKPDGSFRLDMRYFNYCQGLTMTGGKFARLFGRGPRRPESSLSQLDMDLAASIQAVTETIMLRITRHVREETGQRNLCLAGGVALNCVANGRLLREGLFDDVWIQPAAGDAGGALGTALFIWHQLLEKPRSATSDGADRQRGSLLGPAFSDEQVLRFLEEENAPFERFDDEAELCRCVATLLAEGKVVGWMQGRMEFGPRALGARSILGDARQEQMQSTMNRKIKFRESFRPFAPSVLQERAADYFDFPPGQTSPYMLLTTNVAEARRTPSGDGHAQLRGLDKLKARRSEIGAVTHVDYSARLQTVDKRHGRFQRLLKAFYEQTGCPVLINTSFNVRGEPIVCSPADAYRCFLATNIDVLVMGSCLLRKNEQTSPSQEDVAQHLAQFALD